MCIRDSFVIAIGLVEVLHLLAEGKTFGLIVSGCFAESHNGNNGVLVSCVGSFQAAVALLVTEEELMAVILLEELDLLADVFETGQSLDQGYVVSLCDCLLYTSFRKTATINLHTPTISMFPKKLR